MLGSVASSTFRAVCAPATGSLVKAAPAYAQETVSRDHSVTVTSTVPVISGQKSTLYVRERALPEVLRNGAGDKVVLFIHGAGTPAEVSFDVPYQDYSWMEFLASAERLRWQCWVVWSAAVWVDTTVAFPHWSVREQAASQATL